MKVRPLIVVGHKNPDTDSICAAVSYARLKSLLGTPARPYRAGNLNAQTRYVLERFGCPAPSLLTDVYPRLSDIMIGERELITVRPREALGNARSTMLERRFSFLPVTDDQGHCLGMVSLLSLAAAPEHLAGIRTGTEITFYPEELLARTGGWTAPGHALPHAFSGTVVAPVIDGFPTAETPLAPDTAAAVDTGARLFIVPAQHSSSTLADHNAGPQDMAIVYGWVTDSTEGAEDSSQGGPRYLFLPSTLLETIVAIYDATPLERQLEPADPVFRVGDLVRRTEREIKRYNAGGFIVTDDEGIARGVITRVNFLSQTQFQIILVDHNELSQAVDGAEHAQILEVIDHHRLGARSTETPITFINKVVGSTCTIVAEMYRNHGIDPDTKTAGIMLSAILSDTVILKSPTTTALDRDIAGWLAGIAGVDIAVYGEEMFAAGSNLTGTRPAAIIRQDQKLYEDSGFKFVVSQIEMVGFQGFQDRSGEISSALEESRSQLGCDFACLLVTDITRETSLLLFSGADRVAEAIRYPKTGDNLFEMHGVLSRKKQLLPYLLDVLKTL